MMDVKELVEKGNACMDGGKFDEALEFFENALLIDRSDPDLWNRVGVALRSLGRYEESVRFFDQSLRIDPRDRHSS